MVGKDKRSAYRKRRIENYALIVHILHHTEGGGAGGECGDKADNAGLVQSCFFAESRQGLGGELGYDIEQGEYSCHYASDIEYDLCALDGDRRIGIGDYVKACEVFEDADDKSDYDYCTDDDSKDVEYLDGKVGDQENAEGENCSQGDQRGKVQKKCEGGYSRHKSADEATHGNRAYSAEKSQKHALSLLFFDRSHNKGEGEGHRCAHH